MSYSVSISLIFDHSAEDIFDALCRLDEYPLWNSGVTKISKTGRLRENMLIQTEANVVGHVVVSNIEVTKVEPPTSIEMINNSGAVSYRAMYELLPRGSNETEVVCMLQFELRSLALHLARPLIEAMAAGRLRGNLETLKAMMDAR